MYSIKQAAARSGVSIPTRRAWERRYGVVAPVRTPSGYRLYDEEAITRLQQMRGLVASGWRPREAAQRVREGASPDNQPALLASAPAAPTVAEAEAAEQLVEAIVGAAVNFDTEALDRTLDEVFARGSFEWAMETVVFPALRQIGRAWAAGELSVGAEHAASETVRRRVAVFYEAAARPTRSDVVIGLPPGANHDLGALAFGVASQRVGLGVLFLGANVPVDSWVVAMNQSGARLAAVGVPTERDVPAARDVVEALRALPGRLVVAGGAQAAQVADGDIGALPVAIGDAARRAAELLNGRG